MDSLSQFKYCFLIFFFVMTKTFAEPVDWRPKQPFYLTFGYSLTHELYRSQQVTINTVSPPVTYNPVDVYPNNLSGMRLGFGAKLGSSQSRFGYEFDFNQVFASKRITPGLQITRPEKIILGFVDYLINPDSRLQGFLAAGGIVTNIDLTVTTIPPMLHRPVPLAQPVLILLLQVLFFIL